VPRLTVAIEVPWPRGRLTLAKLERVVHRSAMARRPWSRPRRCGRPSSCPRPGARQRRVRRELLTPARTDQVPPAEDPPGRPATVGPVGRCRRSPGCLAPGARAGAARRVEQERPRAETFEDGWPRRSRIIRWRCDGVVLPRQPPKVGFPEGLAPGVRHHWSPWVLTVFGGSASVRRSKPSVRRPGW